EVRKEGRRRSDPEMDRRVRKPEDEQRHGPLRERRAEVRDRLPDPELPEVEAQTLASPHTAEPTDRLQRVRVRHDLVGREARDVVTESKVLEMCARLGECEAP